MNTVLYWDIAKPCSHLHSASSTSIQVHPPPPISLQHPQRYNNQNIARNWAVFSNLVRKIQSCPFWLKTGTYGAFEVLIPKPDLDFRTFKPKIHLWANLGRKNQSCPFCLKIGTQIISRMLNLIPTTFFWISDPNSIFGQIWAEKVKFVHFAWKLAHRVSRGCWFFFRH